MEHLECEHFVNIVPSSVTWLRYVDDVLVITPKRFDIRDRQLCIHPFKKTQGALQCSTTNVSQRQQVNNTSTEAAGRAQVGGRVQQEQNAVQNSGNEKPPSYEAAVVKPPPYDLQFHLTPTQPCSQTGIDFGKEQFKIDSANVPKLVTEGTTESALSKEDVFLPSYQDAIRLSFSSDKDLIDNQGKD
nr:uncharacterized protein LOC128689251 [Cherax quadricarinatus]